MLPSFRDTDNLNILQSLDQFEKDDSPMHATTRINNFLNDDKGISPASSSPKSKTPVEKKKSDNSFRLQGR